MSWSVSFIGKPANVVQALEAHSEKIVNNDQSKLEYDEAKPHLIGLVQQNFVTPGASGHKEPIIKLTASGSGYTKDGEQVQRSCTALIEGFYSELV